MADLAQLLSNAAQTNANFNFDSLINDPARKAQTSEFQAQDQAAKNRIRDAFLGGLPMKDGQEDWPTIAKTLIQQGGLEQGMAAANLGIQQQQLAMGQQASAKMGAAEGGGDTVQPIVGPSTSRNTVTIDPSKRADISPPTAQPQGQPQPQQPTVMSILAAQGIPNDQLGAASASVARQLGVDPSAPINIQDPQVRNVLAPAIQQIKRMGLGQVQPPQPGDNPPQGQPQPGPQVAQAAPNPQQNQGTFGAPPATPTRGLVPTGTDPEVQKQIATYTAIASNPAYPKSVQEAALTRLKALQDQTSPTSELKNYDMYRRQGGNLPFNEWQADNESRKTAATQQAKLNATKYASLIDNGTKAQQEIPQLRMLQEQMNDPNFFSGAGEKYNLLYKRLKSAVGIDPDAAVPQEFLRKATAANVLSSLGALKGLGQIRVAEINMAREAASSPDNSVPANKLLTEISIRTHQRNSDIADMAQDYKEKNGSLDAGFDKLVTKYGREHPLFSDSEVKDWGTVIGRAMKAPQQAAGASTSAAVKFNSPADVHAAVAAGKLQKGDTFQDGSGVMRTVP